MNVERDRDWALASLVRAVVNDSGSESVGMRVSTRDGEIVMNKSFARFLLTIVGAERAAEREACAKIASDRAAICQAAYDAGDKTEVHPLNEALHIAQLIRNRER